MTALTLLIDTYGPLILLGSAAAMFLAGFVKGAVGFALPMVAISGVGSILNVEMAIAAMLLPSLVTNTWQAFRQGFSAAGQSLMRHRWLFAPLLIVIFLTAQLVVMVSDQLLFVAIGCGVTVFALLQLAGVRLRLRSGSAPTELGFGIVAGFFGGLAGVWGPPLLIYFTSCGTPKIDQVRVLGLAFLLGTVMLTLAHGLSGLLTPVTTSFSAMMILPAVAGMVIGQRIQDGLDQAKFQKLTLAVLVLAGLNLLRRGLIG